MLNSKLAGMVLALTGSFIFGVSTGECADLSLDEAVSAAIERNPSIAITRLGERSAKARLKQSRGNNSFSVSASSSFSRSDVNDRGASNGNNNSIRASLPIYNGGANDASIKSSEAGVDIAKLETLRECEKLRYDVVKAYYDVLESQKKIIINQDTVDKYQKHLENVEQLYSAGSKAKIDVLRSSVELSNAKQDLIKSQSTYDNNMSILRNLLYMDQSEPINLTDDFAYEAFAPTVDECVIYALSNRKELKIDEYSLKQKELAVKTAKAGWLPSADLSLSAGWEKQGLPSHDNHSYTASVGLSWNIFDSGVTRGKVDSADVDVEKAKLTINKDKNDIELNVRRDYNSMREAEKRFESTKEAVREAEEDYFIASEKYNAGEGIMLDIIDAQEALSKAKHNHNTAQYDYARYKAAVENDMGYNGYELSEEGNSK